MSATSEPTVDPLPPQRPLERFAHMQTDVFCEGCGYNLHGQPVNRDDRLGLMVCRCPECGRFQAAGQATVATSLWMSRLASWLLFAWVLLVLTTVVFAAIGFGAAQLLPVDSMSYRAMIAADGREVEYQNINGAYTPVYAGTTQPAPQVTRTNVRVLTLPRYLQSINYQVPKWVPLIFLMAAGGVGLVAGILLSVFLWHWPKRNYLFTLLLPLIAAGFLISMIWVDESYDLIRAWSVRRIMFWALVEIAFMYAGIRSGRPFARMLLRMFVPPKPRQHLAFLWLVDGKTLPPATYSQAL